MYLFVQQTIHFFNETQPLVLSYQIDGTQRWSYPLPSLHDASLTLINDTHLLISTNTDSYIILETSTGDLVSDFMIALPIAHPYASNAVVLADMTALVGCANQLCHLNLFPNISIIRQMPMYGFVEDAVAYQDETVAVNINETRLVVTRADGAPWFYTAPINVTIGVPVFTAQTVCHLEGNRTIKCWQLNGTLKWQANTTSTNLFSLSVSSNGTMFAMSSLGELFAYSAETGQLLRKYLIGEEPMSANIYSAVTLYENSAIVATFNQQSYILSIIMLTLQDQGQIILKHEMDHEVHYISPLAIGSDSSVHFVMESNTDKNNSRHAHVFSAGLMRIEGITPNHFFTDQSTGQVLIVLGSGFANVPMIECCATTLQGQRYFITPNFYNDTRVECSLDDIPEMMRKANEPLKMQIAIGQRIFSNFGYFQYLDPVQMYTSVPYGAPIGSDYSKLTISIFGYNFVQSPPGLSSVCRFGLMHGSTTFISNATVLTKSSLSCNAPPLSWSGWTPDAPQDVTMEVSIDFDSQQGGRFFYATSVFFSTYFPPKVWGILPIQFPTTGGKALQFSLEKSVPLKDSIKCGFLPVGGIFQSQDADCLRNSTKDLIDCSCATPAFSAPFPNITFYTSINNGVNFNTSYLYIQAYTNPSIRALIPDRGNISGNTYVRIEGNGFFNSDNLVCRFGSTSVKAIFQSTEEVFCTSPSAPLLATHDIMQVLVQVAQNGIDFTANGANFTYALFLRTFRTKRLTILACPGTPECSNHGQCNPYEAKCKCNYPWSGEQCEHKNREGYWGYISLAFLIVTILMCIILILLFIYFNYRFATYSRLLEERDKNDISTAL